ncbi:hypothetical protein C8R43DRAFT_963511 [Mycena crocata]|nr:hypothetical protein C8R43DRAFT_963511 [Mycena crocata]
MLPSIDKTIFRAARYKSDKETKTYLGLLPYWSNDHTQMSHELSDFFARTRVPIIHDVYFLHPAAIGDTDSYPQIRRRRDRVTPQYAFVSLETQVAPNTPWIQTPVEIWLTFFAWNTALSPSGSGPILALAAVQYGPVVMVFPGAGVRWGYLQGHTTNIRESITPAPSLPVPPRFWFHKSMHSNPPASTIITHDGHDGVPFGRLYSTLNVIQLVEQRL